MDKVLIALSGVVVGFILTFVKEIYFEKKSLKVYCEPIDLLFSVGIDKNFLKLHIKLLIHNRSTVRQPLWKLKLLIVNGNEEEIEFQIPNPDYTTDVRKAPYEGGNLFIRKEVPFSLVNVDAKSSDLLEFSWSQYSKIKEEFISDARFYIEYEILNRKIRLPVKVNLTKKTPTLSEIT